MHQRVLCLDSLVYVLRCAAFEILAENDPELRALADTTVGASSSRAYCDFGHHYSPDVVAGVYDFNFTAATHGEYLGVRQYVRLNSIDAATGCVVRVCLPCGKRERARVCGTMQTAGGRGVRAVDQRRAR